MDVRQAVTARRSVRGFLDTPVDVAILRNLAETAARAPSGGNLQPWHVHIVHGEAMARLKADMAGVLARGETETPEYAVYPPGLAAPYATRRSDIGEALYGRLGIPREDRAARRRWFADNFRFFGAPAACFCSVDRGMGPPQWSDLGMYLQTLMLLAVEAGLATCPQECWSMYPETIGRFLGLREGRMLFCGVAIGFEDEGAAANALRSERAPVGEWLSVVEKGKE
ncbi:nitroreductase family protein [Sphingomonas sp. RP10(2022)]|uniref:Nitroreductase family protein n=1 Tax=Sphingomonas liriopis TaxID=2949094 RepID=A0A9X2KRK4_9SPHN|nr:nitroreductase family protein [Sphingomonas liriopis]MCP3736120.1 nitroreductase family protein [Sphingomonas liriopis]